jgi:hypothetical protein
MHPVSTGLNSQYDIGLLILKGFREGSWLAHLVPNQIQSENEI